MDLYTSLKNKLPAEVQRAWNMAMKRIVNWAEDNNINLSKRDLPKKCPYTYEEAMTRDLRKEINDK